MELDDIQSPTFSSGVMTDTLPRGRRGGFIWKRPGGCPYVEIQERPGHHSDGDGDGDGGGNSERDFGCIVQIQSHHECCQFGGEQRRRVFFVAPSATRTGSLLSRRLSIATRFCSISTGFCWGKLLSIGVGRVRVHSFILSQFQTQLIFVLLSMPIYGLGSKVHGSPRTSSKLFLVRRLIHSNLRAARSTLTSFPRARWDPHAGRRGEVEKQLERVEVHGSDTRTQLGPNIGYRHRRGLVTLLRTCSSPERGESVRDGQGQYRQSSAIYMRECQPCHARAEALVGVTHLCARALAWTSRELERWWLGRVAFLLTCAPSTAERVFSPHFEWKRNMLSLKLEISMSHGVDPGLYPNCQT